MNTDGSHLRYADFPGGQVKGTVVDFSTFLISDFGNKTYSVLGGFTWEIKIQDDGSTKVTSLTAGGTFTDDFAKEIKAFGWTMVPEPSSYVMLALGAMARPATAALAGARPPDRASLQTDLDPGAEPGPAGIGARPIRH